MKQASHKDKNQCFISFGEDRGKKGNDMNRKAEAGSKRKLKGLERSKRDRENIGEGAFKQTWHVYAVWHRHYFA